MAKLRTRSKSTPAGISKCPTGIQGLDEITGGGLPRGRPTLVCGSAGCGKTLLAMEFLVRGATRFDEPGVFMFFEETESELAANVRSLGFELPELVRRKRIVLDHVRIERSEIEETGEYDLEGLFVRLEHAIDSIGAKRVVLDTLEALFAGLPSEAVLRAELRRLFHWLKEKGVTAVITAERGREHLTRHGLEEYVSDCVIVLDHRVHERLATRHLRVVKYRGGMHGTNEYPFLIGDDGISVLPITSLKNDHKASSERISSGIPRLDAMLGGKGYFRGSTILLSGPPGSGKTSLAAHFAQAATQRGERALYFAFEESPNQIERDMRSIDLQLAGPVKRGLIRFHPSRPTLYGLEMHLATMFREIKAYRPAVVVVDPITSLVVAGSTSEAQSMVTRLVDFLKTEQITTLFTSLVDDTRSLPQTEIVMSSLMDSWILLKDVESNGERNRVLHVLKSRGMFHSNQVREFLITDSGIDLVDTYLGPTGVLTGAARVAQESLERSNSLRIEQELARRQSALLRKRAAIEQKVAALRSEQESNEDEFRRFDARARDRVRALDVERTKMGQARHADALKGMHAASPSKNGKSR
ncbi:MAG: circadian clock protein KaiC [Planctomycetes bacterium]|nr:circadian clock protein KaiC [Planctomycetota bacterium]